VEERLHGQLSSASGERIAAAGKTLDVESGSKRVIGGPKHTKMPSQAITEMVNVPPIIHKNRQSDSNKNAISGRDSAFTKRLPEI